MIEKKFSKRVLKILNILGLSRFTPLKIRGGGGSYDIHRFVTRKFFILYSLLLILPLQIFRALPVSASELSSPTPGSLVVNEIMKDPKVVPDARGEWFEIYNPTDGDINLAGLIISGGSQSFTITSGVIPAHGFFVLGKWAQKESPGGNGGVDLNFVYSGAFILNNDSQDEITLTYQETQIDTVIYDDGETFPDPIGASMILSAPSLDNSLGENWCVSISSYGDGDLGTPGKQNDSCGEVPLPEEKITICHFPSGPESVPETIEINESSWPEHESHGDTQGACPEPEPEPTPTPPPITTGNVCGTKFEDRNGNGIWDASDGETGLGGWKIQVTDGITLLEAETSLAQENLGEYCFYGIAFGEWTLSEVMQDGWMKTTGEAMKITLGSPDGSLNNNFGNFKFGKISGSKFEDKLSDGKFDPDDMGIPGWKILLTLLGENSTSTATTTNEFGAYEFLGLGPGIYEVSEEILSGWKMTFPATTTPVQVNVRSGTEVKELNFLNAKIPLEVPDEEDEDEENEEEEEEENGDDDKEETKEHGVFVCKYKDISGDGNSTTTDDILFTEEPGWEMRVFYSSDSLFATTTTSNGCAGFSLQDGDFKISEVQKENWTLTQVIMNGTTTPVIADDVFGNYIAITLSSTTQATTTVDFFNHFQETETQTPPSEPPASPPPSGGGGGGGGSGLSLGLNIHTESAVEASGEDKYSVVIQWFTNELSTSRVVYDTVSHSELGSAPNYGYATSTETLDTAAPKVTFHSVIISELLPNVTYYFRPVSSASPEKIGKEVSYTIIEEAVQEEIPPAQELSKEENILPQETPTPIPTPQSEEFGIGGEIPREGEILGTEFTEEDIEAEEPEETPQLKVVVNTSTATTIPAVTPPENIWKYMFWVVFAIFIVWIYYSRRQKKETSGKKPDDDITPPILPLP